jgi:hypothetical protein
MLSGIGIVSTGDFSAIFQYPKSLSVCQTGHFTGTGSLKSGYLRDSSPKTGVLIVHGDLCTCPAPTILSLQQRDHE